MVDREIVEVGPWDSESNRSINPRWGERRESRCFHSFCALVFLE